MSADEARRRLAARPSAGSALLAAFTSNDEPGAQLFAEVVSHLDSVAPKLLSDARLHMALFAIALRKPRWLRPLSRFEPAGRSRDRQFRSFVDHLLVRYPVPEFLYATLGGSEPRPMGLDLLAHLGAGRSMRSAIDCALLPVAMTRAMCHEFVNIRGTPSLVVAVRRAQVVGFGGPRGLADAIGQTFLGRELVDDFFWSRVIEWLCRERPVPHEGIGHLLDSIRHRRHEEPEWIPDARTLRACPRRFCAWQSAGDVVSASTHAFAASGFRPRSWVLRDDLDEPEETDGPETAAKHMALSEGELEAWTLTEILSAAELALEGRRLRHCVLSYAPLVRRGESSIWSLQRCGRRRVTIEVCNRSRRVVQVRGRRNRLASTREIGFVRRWAKENGLRGVC